METPAEVIKLIDRFHQNASAYRSGQYNETQVRREFIDPFFEALGWDISNKGGMSEAYKDVIHEDAVKIGGSTKAPDYGFRIGGSRKFFVEAKKPAVNLRDNISPAFQLRRYAWSANLPLSILTDFEEFVVYDCRIRPDKDDKTTTARTLYYEYSDYLERWEEIAALFSREAVLAGSLEQYTDLLKDKKGVATVDAAFLKEIETWRELLAKDIAHRNPTLTQRELNYAVQMTIDRIIFLRISEDRGIEPNERLKSATMGGEVYKKLTNLFLLADDRYNSGLFHFAKEKDRPEMPDDLTLHLTIADETLTKIIRSTYYPDSPYEFSVLPIEILGQVYEQFLGKVIHLTDDRQAIVEEKPEVRKAGGVYYTPDYIVNYIVRHTVGKLVEGKTPRQVAKLRIADPACGSGSFLIGAYQFLLDWHRDWYVADGVQKHKKELYQALGGDWRLTSAERKRILLNNIYGVDIDAQAVEVTKLSLLLKVLEGENEQTLATQLRMFQERALPDLGNNIKCGNSLIGSDFYNNIQASFLDDEERYHINVFDWGGKDSFPEIMQVGGFDAIIGNPPYDVMEKERGASSWPHIALAEYVKKHPDYQPALGGKLNLFRFFIVRSLMLVRENGHFGMIVPMAILADISCSKTRRHVLLSTSDLQVDCFPQKDNARRRVFLDAKLSTTILTSKKASQVSTDKAGLLVRTYPWNSFDDPYREAYIQFGDLTLVDPDNMPIPLVDSRNWQVCKKIYAQKNVIRLGDERSFQVTRGEINQTIYRKFIVSDPTKARLLKGVEVGQYQIRDKLSQGSREWFDEEAFRSTGAFRPIINKHRIATQRITGVDERLRVVAMVVEPPTYFADSTNSIVLNNDAPYRLEYLLGLLNSRLFQWRFKLTSTNNNVGTNELEAMPFRTINFSDNFDKARHTQMIALVERLIDLHKRLVGTKTGQEKTVLQRQFEATDRQIDRLVYELYDLSEDEIQVVEDSVKK